MQGSSEGCTPAHVQTLFSAALDCLDTVPPSEQQPPDPQPDAAVQHLPNEPHHPNAAHPPAVDLTDLAAHQAQHYSDHQHEADPAQSPAADLAPRSSAYLEHLDDILGALETQHQPHAPGDQYCRHHPPVHALPTSPPPIPRHLSTEELRELLGSPSEQHHGTLSTTDASAPESAPHESAHAYTTESASAQPSSAVALVQHPAPQVSPIMQVGVIFLLYALFYAQPCKDSPVSLAVGDSVNGEAAGSQEEAAGSEFADPVPQETPTASQARWMTRTRMQGMQAQLKGHKTQYQPR